MADYTEVLENSEDIKAEASDLESLLAAVNSKNFNPSSGLVEEPAKFEKVDSFFALVKDANNDESSIDKTLETTVNEPVDPAKRDLSQIDQNTVRK